jgi:hypothetical protein
VLCTFRTLIMVEAGDFADVVTHLELGVRAHW